ncbi:unnamed protein product [Allacma fusca]|uniref:Uncharacterized protein n=1 Tax=Allacma fusca TaxID=39272 RepID=A0A8J2JVQ4_9HEXA|nr:unnamed protein product [Allacma fusca]
MSSKFSPRTLRHRKRKQRIVERAADMPAALLTTDNHIFIRRDANNLPDDCYAELVEPSLPQPQRLDTRLMEALEINYEAQIVQENESCAIDTCEVTIDGNLEEIASSVSQVRTGKNDNGTDLTPLHTVSLKLATLANEHKLTDVTINAMLKIMSEVTMFYPTSIPKNIRVLEDSICTGV